MDTGVLKKLLGADSISSRWWKIDQKYFTDQIGIAPRNLYARRCVSIDLG
jgi:hypothetical protein